MRKIVRPKAVAAQVNYSRTQIWRKSNDPDDDFPAPIQLGPNSIGFFQDEIDAYLESRPRGHLTQAPKLKEYQRGQPRPQMGGDDGKARPRANRRHGASKDEPVEATA